MCLFKKQHKTRHISIDKDVLVGDVEFVDKDKVSRRVIFGSPIPSETMFGLDARQKYYIRMSDGTIRIAYEYAIQRVEK